LSLIIHFRRQRDCLLFYFRRQLILINSLLTRYNILNRLEGVGASGRGYPLPFKLGARAAKNLKRPLFILSHSPFIAHPLTSPPHSCYTYLVSKSSQATYYLLVSSMRTINGSLFFIQYALFKNFSRHFLTNMI
jgi:hypothetical protein